MWPLRYKYKVHVGQSLRVKYLWLTQLRSESTGADLNSAYKPGLVEAEEFECYSYFKPKVKSDASFSLILPPPNITGNLHLGHALTATVQDVIVRCKQMEGVECVWVPGIDHAGIATQVVVEKLLWNEKRQTRHDIGREHFQERIWKWKKDKAEVIEKQLRQLGVSLDWSRQIFTMDPTQSSAVTKAFVQLFELGLIYRADHLVNWSCCLQSAISDIEVDHVEIDGPTQIQVPTYEKPVEFGTLTYFAYKLCDSDEEIVVGTTRPETMLGDVAVAVNPRDARYARYIGRHLWHPFRHQKIPIICDSFVDSDFGTGAVKITPAHDPTDFAVGQRHSLDNVQVIDEKGCLTSACGDFAGIRRFEARDVIVSRLDAARLLRGKQDHKMVVPICSRSKDVVEYMVKPQWFVRCSEMASEAVESVRTGRLRLEPKQFERVWFDWLENIRDWCISRQLWWGHRIPAYSCRVRNCPETVSWIAAENASEAFRKASIALSSDDVEIEQDEDVLDTWFSSALLPFSSFGWPQQVGGHYPLNIMETGHDILFFWVARMVMLGTRLTGRLPFDKVLLHGIICDAQGRKMSKSLGNVVQPEDVIYGATLERLETGSKANHDAGILSFDEMTRAVQGQKKMFPSGIPECGTDALRFTLCSHNVKNHFINFDVQECYTNKLFCNKIWQATRYTNSAIDKMAPDSLKPIKFDELAVMDRWILSRLSNLVHVSKESLQMYDFHVTTASIKDFLYFNFCDVYLETTKRAFKLPNMENAAGHCWTLTTCLDTALRVLAPFMPRLAQHLHKKLQVYPEEKRDLGFPEKLNWRDETLEEQVTNVLEVVVAIRRMKKLFGIAAKHQAEVYIVGDTSFYEPFKATIEDLTLSHKVSLTSQVEQSAIKDAICDRVATNTQIFITVPSELRNAFELDLSKAESKKTKVLKELEKMNKMISGDNYRVKAKPEAQQMHAKKITMLQEKLARITYMESMSKK